MPPPFTQGRRFFGSRLIIWCYLYDCRDRRPRRSEDKTQCYKKPSLARESCRKLNMLSDTDFFFRKAPPYAKATRCDQHITEYPPQYLAVKRKRRRRAEKRAADSEERHQKQGAAVYLSARQMHRERGARGEYKEHQIQGLQSKL